MGPFKVLKNASLQDLNHFKPDVHKRYIPLMSMIGDEEELKWVKNEDVQDLGRAWINKLVDDMEVDPDSVSNMQLDENGIFKFQVSKYYDEEPKRITQSMIALLRFIFNLE